MDSSKKQESRAARTQAGNTRSPEGRALQRAHRAESWPPLSQKSRHRYVSYARPGNSAFQKTIVPVSHRHIPCQPTLKNFARHVRRILVQKSRMHCFSWTGLVTNGRVIIGEHAPSRMSLTGVRREMVWLASMKPLRKLPGGVSMGASMAPPSVPRRLTVKKGLSRSLLYDTSTDLITIRNRSSPAQRPPVSAL